MQKYQSLLMSFVSPQIGTFLVLGFSITALFILSVLWGDQWKTVRLSFQVRGLFERRFFEKNNWFLEVLCGNQWKIFHMVNVFHMGFPGSLCSFA